MQLALIFKVLLLLAVANGTPVVAKKLLRGFLSYPLDAGKAFIDGRALLGSSKTIRGILVSVIATSICAPLLGFAWTIGLLIGLAAMVGDLLSSFIKRRMGFPPTGRALGLDQIPESLFPALACKSLLALTYADVIFIVGLFSFGNLIVSHLLFSISLRDEPH